MGVFQTSFKLLNKVIVVCVCAYVYEYLMIYNRLQHNRYQLDIDLIFMLRLKMEVA